MGFNDYAFSALNFLEYRPFQLRPRRDRRQRRWQHTRRRVQLTDERAQFPIAAKRPRKRSVFVGAQSPQHIKTGLFLSRIVDHIYSKLPTPYSLLPTLLPPHTRCSKLSRNFINPRRIRALIVPSGWLSASAISC